MSALPHAPPPPPTPPVREGNRMLEPVLSPPLDLGPVAITPESLVGTPWSAHEQRTPAATSGV